MMDRNDFESWLSHPVTRWYLSELDSRFGDTMVPTITDEFHAVTYRGVLFVLMFVRDPWKLWETTFDRNRNGHDDPDGD